MDPLSLAGAGAAAAKSTGEETGKLMSRLLGPTADVLGQWLADLTSYRLNNTRRIVENAAGKTEPGVQGEVPPRVAFQILQEGSLSDNELIAEYLGGVLAASRTPSGRDDRGVSWADFVNGMSALEIRAHFMLYRAWEEALRGQADVDLWTQADRDTIRLYVDEIEFQQLLVVGSDVPTADALSHALIGLQRRGLITASGWGSRDHVTFKNHNFTYVISTNITFAGIELYGWALGLPGLTASDFTKHDRQWAEEDLPRLTRFTVPGIAASTDS